MPTESLSPQQAFEAIRNSSLPLIDVRTPAEFEQEHASPAVNLPLDRLSIESVNALCPDGGSLLLICKSGARATQACQSLERKGLNNLFLVEGGTDAWVRAGLPSVQGRKTISLERQVRIAAGSLVVLGILLSYLSSPFLILSLFVGCGLIFAGVTDTCGMAMILARMPWNERATVSSCSINEQTKEKS